MSNEFNNYLTKIHKNFTLVKKDFKKHKFTLKEGFITFGYSEDSLVDVIVPQYSTTKPVIKIHDSIFFDNNI